MRTLVTVLVAMSLTACSGFASCDHLVVERQVIEQQADGFVSHSERTDTQCVR